jgi:hypothetical protein
LFSWGTPFFINGLDIDKTPDGWESSETLDASICEATRREVALEGDGRRSERQGIKASIPFSAEKGMRINPGMMEQRLR